jgi:hypothetical protein
MGARRKEKELPAVLEDSLEAARHTTAAIFRSTKPENISFCTSEEIWSAGSFGRASRGDVVSHQANNGMNPNFASSQPAVAPQGQR